MQNDQRIVQINLLVRIAARAYRPRVHGYEYGRHHDHNLRAACLHVLADAVTSLLAIIALLVGRISGLLWTDRVGIVGAIVIAHWSIRLLRSGGAVLLDTVPDPRLAVQIKPRLEVGTDSVTDLRLWRAGPGHSTVIAAIVTD